MTLISTENSLIFSADTSEQCFGCQIEIVFKLSLIGRTIDTIDK
jgi:hypothetical protein